MFYNWDTDIKEVQDLTQAVSTEQENTSFTEVSALSTEISQHMVTPNLPLDPYPMQDMVGVLSRPYPILDKKWTAAYEMGDEFARLTFPTELFKIKSIAARMRNFCYFRAGVRVVLRLNGTPFHYGKLLVAWSPAHSLIDDVAMRTDNLFSCSGLPFVIVSPTSNEVNEMILPYTLPYPYISLEQRDLPQHMFGDLIIKVLNPLRLGANQNAVSVTVFANFEQPEFAGMTAKTDTIIYAQALNEAVAKSRSGVVSSVLESLSGVAGSLTRVPLVSGMASVAQGVTSGLAGVARAIGFCKPNSLAIYESRILRIFNNAWSHGLEQAPMLSLKPDNQVAPAYDLMGSFKEEMTLSHLLSTPSLLYVGLWQVADGPGSLHSFPVTPNLCQATIKSDVVEFNPTVLAWATCPYRFWRGSLRFCLQITCSAFHSGRLRVVWDPCITAAQTIEENANCVNHIIDIQEETEFFFSVPYLKNTPWTLMHDGLTPFNLSRLGPDKLAYTNGKVSIDIINVLTHTQTPVPDVNYNLWVSAGEDFQVAYPESSALVYAQGLTREFMRTHEYPALIKGMGAIDHSLLMGEEIMHLKDVLLRPVAIDVNMNILPGEGTNLFRYVFPSYPMLEFGSGSFINWYRFLYRFARGSITHKFLKTNNSRGAVIVGNYLTTDKTSRRVLRTQSYYSTGVACFDHTTPAMEATTPYYAIEYANVSTTNVNELSLMPGVFMDYMNKGVSASMVVTHFMSAGDDFVLGFIVGPPMVSMPLTIRVAKLAVAGFVNETNTRRDNDSRIIAIQKFGSGFSYDIKQEGGRDYVVATLPPIDENILYKLTVISEELCPWQFPDVEIVDTWVDTRETKIGNQYQTQYQTHWHFKKLPGVESVSIFSRTIRDFETISAMNMFIVEVPAVCPVAQSLTTQLTVEGVQGKYVPTIYSDDYPLFHMLLDNEKTLSLVWNQPKDTSYDIKIMLCGLANDYKLGEATGATIGDITKTGPMTYPEGGKQMTLVYYTMISSGTTGDASLALPDYDGDLSYYSVVATIDDAACKPQPFVNIQAQSFTETMFLGKDSAPIRHAWPQNFRVVTIDTESKNLNIDMFKYCKLGDQFQLVVSLMDKTAISSISKGSIEFNYEVSYSGLALNADLSTLLGSYVVLIGVVNQIASNIVIKFADEMPKQWTVNLTTSSSKNIPVPSLEEVVSWSSNGSNPTHHDHPPANNFSFSIDGDMILKIPDRYVGSTLQLLVITIQYYSSEVSAWNGCTGVSDLASHTVFDGITPQFSLDVWDINVKINETQASIVFRNTEAGQNQFRLGHVHVV